MLKPSTGRELFRVLQRVGYGDEAALALTRKLEEMASDPAIDTGKSVVVLMAVTVDRAALHEPDRERKEALDNLPDSDSYIGVPGQIPSFAT